MNVMRYTVVDRRGAVSFIAHCDLFTALVAACARNPRTIGEMLASADEFFHGVADRILCGLAVFDEWNTPENCETIHKALRFLQPEEQPVFRVLDEVTREASLQPVKAGAVIFNLNAKRIVQLQNGYKAIGRSGRGRVFDGQRSTSSIYVYRLPAEWSMVP
ncbi:MAG: hypothetical protein HY677_07455 [Chloroflexi bacterium]|nr:hypothetical protein [Chloroflexota bacterium]